MLNLVDIVNWNADASCLSAERWLSALEGGAGSEFCQWLYLYIHFERPVCLGLTGATLADLATFNPEALGLMQGRPDIFSFVRRPFAHDIGFLRTSEGLSFNLHVGAKTLQRTLGVCPPAFLPPEFMCNARKISALSRVGVTHIFVNPARFDQEITAFIPVLPYRVRGLFNEDLVCIPLAGQCTDAYLKALQRLDVRPWNESLRAVGLDTIYTWRDGESCFLLPDSIARERHWLEGEMPLRRTSLDVAAVEPLDIEALSYPVHPFTAWTREMKMYWYLAEVRELENRLHELDDIQRSCWLLAINSDILSSVEKRSPVVPMNRLSDGKEEFFTIRRQDKSVDGEECIALVRGEPAMPSKRASHLLREARLAFLALLQPFPVEIA